MRAAARAGGKAESSAAWTASLSSGKLSKLLQFKWETSPYSLLLTQTWTSGYGQDEGNT
jgi:hypothetical protein